MTTAVAMEKTDRPGPRPGVFDRMTQILDVFFTGSGRLLLEDVSRATGLPRSTAFRMLTQLVELHWLEHTDRGYRLGIRAQSLRLTDLDELRYAAAPILNDLHLQTSAVAHLAVLEGNVVRYVDKIGGAASATMPSQVGARLTANRTVSGKCMLACLPPEDVEALLSAETHANMGRLRLPSLHRELDRIRGRHGLAIDAADQCGMGITAVAMPIFGRSGPVGSISVATRDGHAARDLAPLVASAARRVARALGVNPRDARRQFAFR